MRKSLKHVAEKAGVSIRTVQRTLKGSGYVSGAVRARVLEAAGALEYRPNLAARALKTGKSLEIGVILSSMDELHARELAGFEKALREREYSVHVIFCPADPRENDVADILGSLQIRTWAGVAIFPVPHVSTYGALMPPLSRARIPCVVLDPRHEVAEDAVHIDRPRGVHEAVMHLARQGRTRIAYLGPVQDRSRLGGYESALRDLQAAPLVVSPPSWELTAMDMAVDELLRLGVDGVQAYSDVAAMRLLAVLHRRGIRVPEDMAVVGFDDRDVAALAWPALTTVAQPNHEVGLAAAAILLGKMSATRRPDAGWSRTLSTRLIVRESA